MDDQQKQLLQKRNAGLEKQLAEKTSELQQKNRELEIEAALERVRSGAMSMQTSEELGALIGTVFTELTGLDLVLTRCVIWIFDPKTNDATWWMANSEDPSHPMSYFFPYHEQPPFLAFMNEWKKHTLKWVYDLQGKIKKDWDDYLFSETGLSQMPGFIKEGMSAPDRVLLSASFNNFGAMNVASLEHLSSEHFNILLRFAKVFDLTYTRFNDLKQAEAQARESQIQLALEKVRARTMAMQHSDELKDAAALLFQQVKSLGAPAYSCGYNIWEKDEKEFTSWMSTQDGSIINGVPNIPLTEDANFIRYVESKQNGEAFFVLELRGERMQEHYEYLKTIPAFKAYFNYAISVGFDLPETQIHHLANFSQGNLLFITLEPCPEFHDVFKRFAAVFEQTYTRFLDLQTAEAQARESQIQLALERVRARTMAMQHSDELSETASLLFEQVQSFGVALWSCGFNIAEKGEKECISIITRGGKMLPPVKLPLTENPSMQLIYEFRERGVDFWHQEMAAEEIKELYSYIARQRNKNNPGDNQFLTGVTLPAFQIVHFVNFLHGNLMFITLEAHPEMHDIFKRLGSVFEQTYTRFLDLQKAEAQARESQIQLALERVRARTMAMQKSDELSEAVYVLFQQFKELGENPDQATIGVINEDEKVIEYWVTMYGKSINKVFKFSIDEPNVTNKIYKAWKENKKSLMIDLRGHALTEFMTYRAGKGGAAINPDEKRRIINVAFFSKGLLNVQSNEERSEESIKLLERFAAVFDQTYTRFLDLQKAEAQAREAKIEAALERVRSKAMAMHNSQDLADTIGVFYKKLHSFSLTPRRCGVGLLDKEERVGELFTWNTTEKGESLELIGRLKMQGHPVLDKVYESWLTQTEYHPVLRGNEIKEYYKILRPQMAFPDYKHDDVQFGYFFFFPEGGVYAWTEKEMQENELQIYRRFTSVLSLTYKRYKDLQQAEAQAREATIEAALEKVRGKAMAMHNSNDLSVTASLVFTELRKLGINPIRCGVGLLNKESRKAQLYSASSSGNGDSLSLVGWVQLENHPVLEKIYDSWLNNEDYFPELQGKQLQSYYQLLLAGLSVPIPDFTNEQKQYGHFVSFSVGCLYAWSDVHYNEDQIKIFKRFATIVDLTFRRYLELQKSETNAREAVKQAAVNRIRADIASMRTISDLDRITPLIWNELTILGINFIRCGVFIMDDSQKLIHTFLSTPDGKAIAAFHLPYSTPGNIQKVITHWHDYKNYIDHWNESDFTQFAEILVQQKVLSSTEEYLKTIPHEGFYLHFLPFLQGMLYVGNSTELNDDEIKLIQSVADAFSTAYARYEDFNKLEAAKQQIEKTLVDLKQAQQQLVQSEKMASLGELTAGIAHEIQNPLNFVNNFSEINKEMLEELKAERLKPKAERDDQTQDEIINDLIDNEEKINHHGKRADAIVKGMLQHSRKSEGKKEPTDINALCDEYLRLSYHGLRAKDKSFNTDFITDFDESIGKINIVPQDIGRVLLNLYNNAFYAVKLPNPPDKSGQALKGEQYKPLVSVTTRKINSPLGAGGIEIHVNDNGNGIPQNIVDKIFQPFFTTKPTGQGTGLGLSLSYDIIKAHGGEINVKTQEGEGSEFIIQLLV